jgi:hypothetical protein
MDAARMFMAVRWPGSILSMLRKASWAAVGLSRGKGCLDRSRQAGQNFKTRCHVTWGFQVSRCSVVHGKVQHVWKSHCH